MNEQSINGKIRSLFNSGMSRANISKSIGLSSKRIERALTFDGTSVQGSKLEELKFLRSIKQEQLEEYRRSLSAGEHVKVLKKTFTLNGHEYEENVEHAIVIAVYPHIVETTKGVFQLKEIYVWNVRHGRFV